MISDQSTNFTDIYHECGCEPDRDLLWLMYHDGRTEIQQIAEHPRWNQFKNIILIDQECVISEQQIANLDHRVHLWSPTARVHPRTHNFMFWFDWVRIIDSDTKLSQRLLDPDHKQPRYFFDALLGNLITHKKFVYDSIKQSAQPQAFLVGSIQTRKDPDGDFIPDLPGDWISGGDFDTLRVKQEYRPGCLCNPDCMIPYAIYNDSWYTLVVESTYREIFFTEKTGRPLLSKRLFVMFGAKGVLKSLHELGYQTFGSIIDESYDDESNDIKRWDMAWKQVEKLLTLDPVEVYQRIRPILDHNHRVITNSDYHQKMIREIKTLLTTT